MHSRSSELERFFSTEGREGATIIDVVVRPANGKHVELPTGEPCEDIEPKPASSNNRIIGSHNKDAVPSPFGTFRVLPGEMRLHVLSFLPVEDLVPVSRLNRHWNRMVADDGLWKLQFVRLWKREVQEEEERRKLRRKEHLEREYQVRLEQLEQDYQRKKQLLQEEFRRKKKKLKRNWKNVFENHFMLQKNWEQGKACVDSIDVKRVVNCVLVDEDKDMIICGNHSQVQEGQAGEINFWSLSEKRCLRTIAKAHDKWVRGLCWEQTRLFSCSNDKVIKAWDVDTGNLVGVYEGHDNNVPMLQLSLAENVMISCSRDQTVKIWDVGAEACVTTLTGHAHAVNCVRFNGNTIISGDREGHLKVWDVRMAQAVRGIATGLDVVHCMEFLKGGTNAEIIIGGGGLRTDDTKYPLEIWDIGHPACRTMLEGPTGFNWTMQCDPSKSKLVVGGADRIIRVWNIETGDLACEVVDRSPAPGTQGRGHEDSIYSLQFGPSTIVSGSKDQTVCIWNFAKEQKRRKRSRRKHSSSNRKL